MDDGDDDDYEDDGAIALLMFNIWLLVDDYDDDAGSVEDAVLCVLKKKGITLESYRNRLFIYIL